MTTCPCCKEREAAEVKILNLKNGHRQELASLIGTIRQLQHEAKQAREKFDEQIARAAAIYDEAQEAHKQHAAELESNLDAVRKQRNEIIGDVTNAEANAEQWKRRAAANYAEGMAAVNGRQAIVNDLIRIRDTVRIGARGHRPSLMEWAYEAVLAIINQATAPASVGTGRVNIKGVTMANYSVACGPRREPYVYDLTFETIDLLRSEGHGHVMAIDDGFHVTVANNDEGDALRVTVYPGNVTREQDWRNWPIGPLSVPTDRRDFPAAKAAVLDALRRAWSQSPGSAQSQTRREPMTTKETIAKVIGILQMITMLTPIKFDDTALEFVIWASEKPWFIALVERIKPASTSAEAEAQSLLFEPELVEGLADWSSETGRQVAGRSGKLLALIMQAIALAKALKPIFAGGT